MADTPFFPLFVNLSGRKILIVGAGEIALRRARVLAEFGSELTVTAPDGKEEMNKLALVWNRRSFEERDLEGADLVFAATSDEILNEKIFRLCKERNILVNNCSNKEQCDFYFPGIAKRENLVIGVTASGKDHRIAAIITKKLQRWLEKL